MAQLVLVRHGQASFGAADYDVLSETGEQQARIVGEVLRELSPVAVVHGSLRRQRETARLAAEAAGWTAPLVIDARWNELDDLSQFATAMSTPPPDRDRAAFQRWYEEAVRRWASGEHDDDYTESYAGLHERVDAALVSAAERAVGAVGAGGDVVVVSSGGPLSAVATRLLGAGVDTYLRLLPIFVNTGITRVVVGSRGRTLVTLNEHTHLAEEQRTYR